MNNMHETRSERPESLWLARRMWLAAVAMEAVHQLLGVVRAFVDPSDIRSEMRPILSEHAPRQHWTFLSPCQV